ncbi:recombinase family protein [Altererythrobacter arenosus]|uniref:Recombinase family protein n=1 Tax=Altererythrobacter arenosus TaxID=3032592 RepID=A0ABY8FTF2_9SPHN|nr:recombinase family protein [Altererythrobacter sp. CAU 1644]WFL78294.1 recombinase family protein [Altererythrobacter sp. CAU 1644]
MASREKQMRCAIYTRKSTDEGLDKEFNSLDAQREACAAYVMSQQHEGWTLIPDLYDDGGHSGGTLERPALKQLLADVENGKVDVVVVYKIDRLTRSLADFAKIVDVLDEAEASFVSVTQAFSTTSSMGRLTLNVLLSFAQFEREVGAERIRDKIAASKAKGMWMGGGLPLGYDAVERKLVPLPEEAETVRIIMQRYLKSSSIRSLVQELERDGFVSKRRVSKKGNVSGGLPFRRGALKWLLSNPIYVGKIRHKDKVYPGLHEAIIDRELFDAVQEKLKANTTSDGKAGSHRRVSLLAGMIRDDRGRPMSPTHTQNHGRRYTYYASNLNDDPGAPALRLPAGEIEQSVRSAVAQWLNDQPNLQKLAEGQPADRKQSIFEKAGELSVDIQSAPNGEARADLRKLKLKISVSDKRIKGTFSPSEALDLEDEEHAERTVAQFAVPIDRQTYGHEPRLRLVPTLQDKVERDQRMVELLGRAFQARDALLAMSESETKSMKTTRLRHLQRLARLSYLDPSIVRGILHGTQPKKISARSLWRMGDLPLRWADQRRALSFDPS